MEQRIPAEVFPPGDFLREELEARELSQADLAEIIGKSPRLVNEIIAAKRSITPETATLLESALGLSAQFWLNLEAHYQLFKVKVDGEEVRKRAELYETYPVTELVRRGWVEPSASIEVLKARILSFYHQEELATPCFHPIAARKASTVAPDAPHSRLLTAWLFRLRQIAEPVKVKPFDLSAMPRLIEELQSRMHEPTAVADIPALLAEYGIRIVFLEPFKGMKVDGVCTWLGENEPLIGMSLRYNRIDNFWFVLLHELGHVRYGDAKTKVIVDEDLGATRTETSQCESRADSYAQRAIIPKGVEADFAALATARISEGRLMQFAAEHALHPGLVVGQLHGRKVLQYSHFRKHLEHVREHLAECACLEGWGKRLN